MKQKMIIAAIGIMVCASTTAGDIDWISALSTAAKVIF
jgi:hypothetical protein